MSASAPSPAVAIVLQRDDRILFIQRAAGLPRAGYWTPPTGRVEPDESLAAAVEREAREELGLIVRARDEVWHCLTDDGRYRLHWWRADILSGQLTPDPAEVAAARWLTFAEYLACTPRFSAHQPFFAELLPQLR